MGKKPATQELKNLKPARPATIKGGRKVPTRHQANIKFGDITLEPRGN